jgi:restriction endonuclease S subunit
MEESVVNMSGLEMFAITGAFPKRGDYNYKRENSFTYEFPDSMNGYKKYHYVISNPPYGGDKTTKSAEQIKRDKIINYIKSLDNKDDYKDQLKELKTLSDDFQNNQKQQQVNLDSCSKRIKDFAKKYKLNGTDKEACSLILLADMLDTNGTAIGVLKEGVFFNNTYKDLRKCLIENYNVREVISVPSDQFENTSTKTSIIIFDNTKEKTREVKFYDLIVERYDEDKFIDDKGRIKITNNKDDILGINDTLVSVASREEILANAICSLNGKDYNKKVIVCGEGYELVRLGDICKCLTTTKHCTNIGKQEGKYKFYNSSQDSKLYVDFCEVKDYSIILGQGGNFNIHIDKNFTASKHVCVIQPNSVNDILLNYLYYIIPELQKSFITNGSTISWLNKTNIRDFKIPIPQSEQKIIEWVDKISKPYDEKNSKQNKIKELEEYVKNKIKDIGDNEDCDEVELGSICELKDGYDFYRDEMDNRKTYIEGENLPLLKIGCDAISDYIKINKKYDKYIVNKGDIVIGTKGTCGKIRKININKAYHKHGLLKIIEFKINKNYLYYLLLLLLDDETIEKMTNKSVLSNMKKEKLIKMKLLIPKNKQLINDLESTFVEIEKLLGEVKEAETLYNQLIKELSDEAIPANADNIIPANAQELSDNVAKLDVDVNNTTSSKSSTATSSSTGTSSIKSLHEQCKSLGIKGYSKYKKIEDKEKILKLIEEHK